jgi:uncharacterized protein YceK
MRSYFTAIFLCSAAVVWQGCVSHSPYSSQPGAPPTHVYADTRFDLDVLAGQTHDDTFFRGFGPAVGLFALPFHATLDTLLFPLTVWSDAMDRKSRSAVEIRPEEPIPGPEPAPP